MSTKGALPSHAPNQPTALARSAPVARSLATTEPFTAAGAPGSIDSSNV